jgi:putative flippase GtrA
MKIERSDWWYVPQKLRFVAAGMYNTLFAYATFATLLLLAGQSVHYLVIAAVNHAIAVSNAFLLHRLLVFRSQEPWLPSFIRFNVSQLVTLAFGMAMLFSLVEYGKLRPLAAQSVVMVVSVVLSYLLHRNFSFATGGSNSPSQ